MPRYEYLCPDCGQDYDLLLSIHADIPATIRCTCSADMSRVYSTFGIVLKGQGWGGK